MNQCRDFLEEMMEMQDKLNAKVGCSQGDAKNFDEKTLRDWLVNYNSAQIAESGEFWSELGKWWKSPKEDWREKAKEELIDEFHFWMSKALLLGMTNSDIRDVYFKKNEKNFGRSDWHHNKPSI